MLYSTFFYSTRLTSKMAIADTPHTVNVIAMIAELVAITVSTVLAIAIILNCIILFAIVLICSKCKGMGRDDNGAAQTQEYEMDGNPC